jgi:NAD(P)-dependent dehydrogenase (short-subunit alcohol dehydrogenase family)
VDSTSLFSKNGCYIVVGGLTGLGWILVEYLSELGAGYIATFSRRKATREQEDQMALIQTKHNCRIIAIQVNVNSIESVETAMEMLKSQIGSCTIRGVFHGGGILCDKQLKQMSEEDIKGPMLPKILGTWNLHAATLNCPLDFFVMHSSIASVFGSQGQCNYAAGNSFEDAFAYYRRQLGLCG